MPLIKDLIAKIEFLLKEHQPRWRSGCNLKTVADLARAMGVAPTTFHDLLSDNDIGVKGDATLRKPLPLHIQRMIGDIFKFDPSHEAWLEGDGGKGGRFQTWYLNDVAGKPRRTDLKLEAAAEEQAEKTRFEGLCELRLIPLDAGKGRVSLAAQVEGRDFNFNGQRYRIEKANLEVHADPAIISEPDWYLWREGMEVRCTGETPNATVRSIPITATTERYKAAPQSNEEQDQLPKSWGRAPHFEVNGRGEEIGIAIFRIGEFEGVAVDAVIWGAVGVRQRDVNPVQIDSNVTQFSPLRRGGLSQIRKCAIKAILKRELFRDADGYFVACWHRVRFQEKFQ